MLFQPVSSTILDTITIAFSLFLYNKHMQSQLMNPWTRVPSYRRQICTSKFHYRNDVIVTLCRPVFFLLIITPPPFSGLWGTIKLYSDIKSRIHNLIQQINSSYISIKEVLEQDLSIGSKTYIELTSKPSWQTPLRVHPYEHRLSQKERKTQSHL